MGSWRQPNPIIRATTNVTSSAIKQSFALSENNRMIIEVITR